MSATQVKYVAYRRQSFWPGLAGIGRAVAYLGVPASLVAGTVFNSINILTSLYLVALFGIIAAFRGTRMPSGLVAIGYFFLAWYVVLLTIELFHGGPFGYPLFGTNYLVDYFVLLAFPFFALGLRSLKADLRMFEYAMMATVAIAAVFSLYQFLWLDAPRPKGLNSNPIPFALIVLMWSLFLFSRALATSKIDRLRLGVALVGLIPILLSASKLVWICGIIGYSALFIWWGVAGRSWRSLAGAAVGAVVLGGVLYQLPFVNVRITGLITEVMAMLTKGDTSGGSFGLRYSAATSGLAAFPARPFLGYGLSGVKAAALEHRALGAGNFAILDHLHDEYVTHLVAFGIPGLVFLLSLFAVFFAIGARAADLGVRRFATVGGATVMIYMVAEVLFRAAELYGMLFFLYGLVFLTVERVEFSWPRRPTPETVPAQ